MPYVWVAPLKFMDAEEAGGTAVYHCYHLGVLMDWRYQIKSNKSLSGWMAFDIRGLVQMIGFSRAEMGTREAHKRIIQQAAADRPLEAWLVQLSWYEGETRADLPPA